MQKEVYSVASITELVNETYVALYADTDTREGKLIYAQFYNESGISIPAFVICNESGQVLKIHTGATRVEEFARFLKQESHIVEGAKKKHSQEQLANQRVNESTKVDRALYTAYQSQWKPGIRLGMHQSSFATNKMLAAYPDAILGWDFGLFIDYTKEGFVFQPVVMFSSKEAMDETSDSEIRISYIEVPLQISFKLFEHKWVGCPQDVRINIAPYAGFAITGKETTANGETGLSFGHDASEFNPLDYGLKMGMSMALGSFEPYMGYLLGLQNISNDAGAEITNRGFYLNLAIVFGK